MARIRGKTPADAEHCVAGVDVSKAHLDVAWAGQRRAARFGNTPDGIAALLAELRGARLVVMEHTGRYHRALWAALDGAGIAAAVLDAARARHLALGLGQVAKTDRLDAAVLAEIGHRLEPAPTPYPDEKTLRLKELQSARQAMCRRRAAAKTQAGNVRDAVLRELLEDEIAGCKTRIERLDAEIAALISADTRLARRAAILRSIPGIGQVAAAAVLAWMPEIGTLTASQTGALSGTAPLDNASGKATGRATPKGGRRILRSLLHLPSITAMRCNPDFKAFRERLEKRNKPTFVIITAITRKLLILANALIADDREWTAVRP